ncbi:2196_t:CDS:2, partial [Funneliformis geosporum]
ELEEQLCYFIHSIKKQDGTEYYASSVNNSNKGLAEHTGSSGFSEEEILHIINHPIMTDENPSVPKIIKMYEKYFAKLPTQASSNFYLKPCNINE